MSESMRRGEWIRTTGLSVPNRALDQAELRPEVHAPGWIRTNDPSIYIR